MKIPDWSMLIIKIGTVSKLKDYQIAQRVGVVASTLANTKQGMNDPRWIFGERLLNMAKQLQVEIPYR